MAGSWQFSVAFFVAGNLQQGQWMGIYSTSMMYNP
jgi:hypothetical protein